MAGLYSTNRPPPQLTHRPCHVLANTVGQITSLVSGSNLGPSGPLCLQEWEKVSLSAGTQAQP